MGSLRSRVGDICLSDREQAFSVGTSPSIGAVAIEHWLDQSLKILKDGQPNLSLFAFVLKNAGEAGNLKIGDVVALNEES